MLVQIYFIRHGESEANVVQHQTTCGSIKHLLMRDPVLTDNGIEQSKSNQSSMPDVDIVLSSQLLRAIQTALHMYPKQFIHVVPYLNELGTGLDNVPHSECTQDDMLENDSKRVVRLARKNERNFVQYIARNILPKFSGKKHVKIALFTHSRLMKNHLKIPLSELPNNCTVSKKYNFVL